MLGMSLGYVCEVNYKEAKYERLKSSIKLERGFYTGIRRTNSWLKNSRKPITISVLTVPGSALSGLRTNFSINAILCARGLLLSVLITGAMTDGFKDAVGEPRPDFFWRCFPDGNDVYDQFGNVICHGKKSDLKDGYKSFPSGHTSWSFAGLGFLSLYLAGKIKPFDRKGNVIKLCITVLPLIVASLVGISVVDDHYHHWRDVFGGALIGTLNACWGPWAYFHMLEQSLTNIEATDAATATNIEARAEWQQMQQHSGQNNGVSTGLPSQASESTLEDIESGHTR
ncbi:hypothetical protein Syun_023075 [Stephania yunnanensis]|uniref:Phosphatidic acid phosphatase type 2/haloperoxidase domain-containing protein n=1 Tax=Stephania yunnanensis TaxID=152371 RepID=A0AAP0FMQ8_9MAGN